jgi:hypothetical protein
MLMRPQGGGVDVKDDVVADLQKKCEDLRKQETVFRHLADEADAEQRRLGEAIATIEESLDDRR